MVSITLTPLLNVLLVMSNVKHALTMRHVPNVHQEELKDLSLIAHAQMVNMKTLKEHVLIVLTNVPNVKVMMMFVPNVMM